MTEKRKKFKLSKIAERSFNNISNAFSEYNFPSPNNNLSLIDLSKGDPSTSDLSCCKIENYMDEEYVKEVLEEDESYFFNDDDLRKAKEAIAEHHSSEGYKFSEKDVLIIKGR